MTATARVLWLVFGALSSGCFSIVVNGHNYVEPSIPRSKLVIRRVAILPNRLPISLQDPEYWRRYNWGVIESEFREHGITIVDYDTSVDTFGKSGLPVEDTKSSRDKYADVAQQLGVDAIIIPYYGTFGSSSGAVLIDHYFTSVATLQIYLTTQNDFLSRIDASGTYKYTTGYTTVLTFVGLVCSLIPTFVSLAGSSGGGGGSNCAPTDINCLTNAANSGGGGGSSGGMYAGIALSIAMPLIGLIIDAGNARGTPEQHWQKAFSAGIHDGLKPFFAALDLSGQGAAPQMQMTMEQTPPSSQAQPVNPYSAPPQYAPPVAPPPPPLPITDPRMPQCDAGQAQACVAVGEAIVAQNPTAAADLFKRGCRGGVTRGCVRLAAQFQSGVGVERSPGMAATMLSAACDNNDAEGCAMVAPLYDAGLGVPKDATRATDAFRKACTAGRGDSCKQLGDRYRDGKGVALDPAQAQQWYQVACALKAVAPGCEAK